MRPKPGTNIVLRWMFDIFMANAFLCNLQKIEIRNLTNFYNKGLFKHTLGFSGYSTNLHYTDTWSYINVDL